MSIMAQLAESIQLRGIAVPKGVDTPFPNIYFATIVLPDRAPLSVYVSADFITAALKKVANWCTYHHRFRPLKSNSDIKLRRLKLDDLVENPAAFEAALRLAQFNGESDIVQRLNDLPQWVADTLGVPMPKTLDVSSVWDRLQDAVENQERRSSGIA